MWTVQSGVCNLQQFNRIDENTNEQVNSPTAPTEGLVILQSSKRDDDIGSCIRAISGVSFAESRFIYCRGFRWVVGRAPKKWRPMLRLIKLPNLTSIRAGCGDRPSSARCGLGALVGYTGGLVGALHRCRVVRSARTWGENEGLTVTGRKRHCSRSGILLQPLVPVNPR